MIQKIVAAFHYWVLLACGIALVKPEVFIWFSGNFITIGLGVIMLGMGLTLKLEDFKRIFKVPQWVLTGIVLQFTVMPFLGWMLGYVFHLPVYFAVGLVLVSCCPGGTASNVIAFLAKADVALSVTMTAFSTLFAIILTPLLTSAYIGSRVDVDAYKLFLDTVKVVLVPIVAGVLLNKYLPKFTEKVLPVSPLIAMITIILIVASIIGQGKDVILTSGFKLIIAVWVLHISGFGFGYLLSMLLVKKENARRTISIEVGMQNSGLGALLARNNFTNPATAIPCAISSATHCLIGSILAGIWRRKDGGKVQMDE